MSMTTSIKFPNVRDEAKRLNGLGVLRIWFDNDAKPSDRQMPIEGTVIGFAIDGEERDCILVRAPYGMGEQIVVRAIVALHITRIEVTGRPRGSFWLN